MEIIRFPAETGMAQCHWERHTAVAGEGASSRSVSAYCHSGSGLRGHSAFTLLELLVVAAILGLLAALVAPRLSRAKQSGYRTVCLNNERALVAVWMMYASDNNGRLAANGIVDPPDPARKLWVQGVLYHPEQIANAVLLTDPQYALFGDYLSSARTYVCPADGPPVVDPAEQRPKVRSYALNAYVGWRGPLDFRLSAGYRQYRSESELAGKAPTSVMVFQDVYSKSICWPYFGLNMTRDSFFNFPNVAHGAGGMVSFADGRVERHRWQDARTLAAYSADYHLHDEPSPNNPDLAWLRQGATEPVQ